MNSLLALLVAAPTVKIDLSRAVKWEGWGTSLCWMGNAFGKRDDVADLLFTTKEVALEGEHLPGLGMTIVRYNAGACGPGEVGGKRMFLSKNVLPFRQMQGFWLNPDRGDAGWDWNRDDAQRSMMLAAKKRGAYRFELFSNSPMWWMCANSNPSGAQNANDDNLELGQYSAFATYLVKIAAEAPRRWGVRFTSIEPFNEPVTHYWSATGRQEGNHFSIDGQIAFLTVLRRAMNSQGLSRTPVTASDETSFSQAAATWKKMPAETRASISRVNVHGYEESESTRQELASELGDKPRWNSEHGDGDAGGLTTARELSRDLNKLRPSAWCYWQPLDGGGWGLLDCDMPAAKIKRPNPKLFVLAQYTRHIRPGMEILTSDDPLTCIAYDPHAKKLVVVAVNTGEPVTKTVDLSGFRMKRGSAHRWITEPRGTSRYLRQPDVAISATALEMSEPAASIQTYEISDVKLIGK